jgi:RNase P subunit RPR2
MKELVVCDRCGAEDCRVLEFSVEWRDEAEVEILVVACACCGARSAIATPAAA